MSRAHLQYQRGDGLGSTAVLHEHPELLCKIRSTTCDMKSPINMWVSASCAIQYYKYGVRITPYLSITLHKSPHVAQFGQFDSITP